MSQCHCTRYILQSTKILHSLVPSRDRLFLGLHPLFDDIFALLAKLPGVADTESVLEDLLHFFQYKTRDLGVEEVKPDVSEAADSSEEAKCTRWGPGLHHGKESARDDDVGAPVGAGEPHGSHGTHLEREEVGAHPCGVANGDTVEYNKPDNED